MSQSPTPLPDIGDIFAAIEKNDLERLSELLPYGVMLPEDFFKQRDNWGYTPLMRALAGEPKNNIALHLISKGASRLPQDISFDAGFNTEEISSVARQIKYNLLQLEALVARVPELSRKKIRNEYPRDARTLAAMYVLSYWKKYDAAVENTFDTKTGMVIDGDEDDYSLAHPYMSNAARSASSQVFVDSLVKVFKSLNFTQDPNPAKEILESLETWQDRTLFNIHPNTVKGTKAAFGAYIGVDQAIIRATLTKGGCGDVFDKIPNLLTGKKPRPRLS